MAEPQIRLGEIFVAKKLITEDQLNAALSYQKQNNLLLGEALIQMGALTEDQLLRALSQQFKIPYVRLIDIQVPPGVIKEVPSRMVWDHHFMPVELQGDVLTIAVSNPLDVWPMLEIQRNLRFHLINRVLAKKNEIDSMIKKYYGSEWGQ